MKAFPEFVEVKDLGSKDQQLKNNLESYFGPLISVQQFDFNRNNLMNFLMGIVKQLNQRIEAREGKAFRGNYRNLSNIPSENIRLFKELKNNPDQFEKFFQLQLRRGLEELSFMNTKAKGINIPEVDALLKQAVKIFCSGLNQDNLKDLEFWLSNKLKKLKQKDE